MSRQAWLARSYGATVAVGLVAFVALLLGGAAVGRAWIAAVFALACVMVAAAFAAWIGRSAVGADRVLLAVIVVSRLSLGVGVLVTLFAHGSGIALLVASVVLNVVLWAWGRRHA